MVKKQTTKKAKEPDTMKGMASGIPVYCRFDEILKIEKAMPHPKNPNTHPERQIELLSRIIRSQGFRAPITISHRSGFITRGHARLAASRVLALTEIPVEYQFYKDENSELEDMIADNKIADFAKIDRKVLKSIVSDMQKTGADLSLTGMDSDELLQLLKNEQHEPTAEIEKPKKTRTKLGDIWELGKHRLICGDSTKADTVMKLMNGKKAHLLFTDPPYGVNYGENSKQPNKTEGGKRKGKLIIGDDLKKNNLINTLLLPAFKLAFQHTRDDAAFFIWHASSTKSDFDYAVRAANLEEKQQIIWIKPQFVLGRSDYHYKHEPAIYAQKIGHKARMFGNRDQSTVWEFQAAGINKGDFSIGSGIRLSMDSGMEIFIKKQAPKSYKGRIMRLNDGEKLTLSVDDGNSDTWFISPDNKNTYAHPTQKPTELAELAELAIRNHTNPEDIVLDLFSGSGSTLIAAEKTERVARVSEIDPGYCDMTAIRYARFCKQNKRTYSIKLNGTDITADYKDTGI